MKKALAGLIILTCFIGLLPSKLSAQNNAGNDTTEKVTMPELTVTAGDNPFRTYRASATKINDLVHTKLAVSFSYAKRELYGKAWITLRPHFYPTDSLSLDAKWMDIKKVALDDRGKLIPLSYTYDSMKLHIQLGKTFTKNQSYTIYIDYVSRPEAFEAAHHGGSSAISDDKGLYFINPDGKDPDKPIQIWTQGETESNSVWFPTIDKPDQKMTEEIAMTVPNKYVTLSNGLLISQKKNADGTRTDTWKCNLPFSPYLVMMAVGDFAIVKDHYKNLPVDFYVEKAYAPYAKDIFGHTPDMIAFYSKILGVPFPWPKYDQIVVRDYVSGAMENVSATLHGEFMEKTRREMLDNTYSYDEDVIAHELFHQWFGDLVTCESWSNITLNESFADFSEMLWAEHEYGKDVADEHSYHAMEEFFRSAANGDDKNLVRFYYKNREDVFDAVSYQKGGRILNMLRNYVGDSAFFDALHLYLTRYKFQSAEAQELRLCFEDITGQDMNWFWNEWYYNNSYPQLDVRYEYDDATHTVQVIVTQEQDSHLFKLPVNIDVYAGGNKKRYKVWVEDPIDTFTFHYSQHPDLVNFDGDKVLLAKIDDHKTIENYAFQYTHAPLYLDRREAIEACAKEQDTNAIARKTLLLALHDKYYNLRIVAMDNIDMKNEDIKQAALPEIINIASHDPKAPARADAISILDSLKNKEYLPLFNKSLRHSSYDVEANALAGIDALEPKTAYREAQKLASDARAALVWQIAKVYAHDGTADDIAYIIYHMNHESLNSKYVYFPIILAAMENNVVEASKAKQYLDMINTAAGEYNNKMITRYVARLFDSFAKKQLNKATNSSDESVKSALQEQADYAKKLMKEDNE